MRLVRKNESTKLESRTWIHTKVCHLLSISYIGWICTTKFIPQSGFKTLFVVGGTLMVSLVLRKYFNLLDNLEDEVMIEHA